MCVVVKVLTPLFNFGWLCELSHGAIELVLEFIEHPVYMVKSVGISITFKFLKFLNVSIGAA